MNTFSKLLHGQSLLRIRMNQGFAKETIAGIVIDVGGGRHPDYFNYFKQAKAASITPVDWSISGIDFEKDPLPFVNESADTIICANVLEHVYDHRLLVGEMRRVLKPGGALIGFVPFLIQYHPDPHDYFRYTKEALARIFADGGFADVSIRSIGGGPFSVNFNNLCLSLPGFLAATLFPFYRALDTLFLSLRPASRERYPLGFIFICR